MGSIAAASYPAHQDSNAFPVKSEYNSYEDQHQLLHSSGEESGTASENRGSQDGPYGAADGEGTRAAFALGSMGPASNQNLTSGATVRCFYVHMQLR